MKYSAGNSSTLFCEQVSTVTSLFEQWNDCERSVVLYALLKRLRYQNLKFLKHSIESNLTQNFSSQNSTGEINANCPIHLQNLISAYKELSQLTPVDKDSPLFGSDLLLDGNNSKNYRRKEDILNDVLYLLLLLKPGNDEAKALYLSLIPIAVEDTVRQIVPTELVQQIFSYLLIHPAISNDDRRSLSHWLRHLEEHIQSSFKTAGQQSFYVLSNSNTDTSSKSTSVSSVGSVTPRNITNTTTWQAIAPPSQSIHKQQLHSIVPSEWSVSIPSITDSLCEDIQAIKLSEITSSQNSLGLIYESTAHALSNSCNSNNNNNSQTDDHHESFSKNGTEIIDFDSCDNCEPSQVTGIGGGINSLLSTCDQFNMPRWSLDSKMTAIKTRRSNSLTTAISSSSSSASSVITVNDNCSNSSENLAQYAQKPRSYSLSIENPRGTLTSSGSDTRLDDLKPNYLKFSTHNVGMGNIGQWLKSLRLHKYIGLFTNMTYEEMMEISEDYLQSLGVTKGASHKLAVCIEKLNDRYALLQRMEEELLTGKTTINAAVEEMTNIVLTPMKPVDATPTNVAVKFFQVLDLVCRAVQQKEMFSPQEEECISVIQWILERAMHSEAFLAQTNQLKAYKFEISKLKMTFTPKPHNGKTGSNGNLNKPRWTNNKSRKGDNLTKTGSNDRIYRKNSNDFLFSMNPQQQQTPPSTIAGSLDSDKFYQISSKSSNHHHHHQNAHPQGAAHLPNGLVQHVNNGGNSQYKSSSYPNFPNPAMQPINLQQYQDQHPHQPQQIQHQQSQHKQFRQHRHSLNNLIVVSGGGSFNSGNGQLTTASNNRRPSLTTSTGPQQTAAAGVASTATTTKPQMEKTMAAVVLENLAKLDQRFKK